MPSRGGAGGADGFSESAPGVCFASGRESMVTGFLRPMVLLPAAWLVEMPPEVLEAVMAHEWPISAASICG